jgi:hypothetical protein
VSANSDMQAERVGVAHKAKGRTYPDISTNLLIPTPRPTSDGRPRVELAWYIPNLRTFRLTFPLARHKINLAISLT